MLKIVFPNDPDEVLRIVNYIAEKCIILKDKYFDEKHLEINQL